MSQQLCSQVFVACQSAAVVADEVSPSHFLANLAAKEETLSVSQVYPPATMLAVRSLLHVGGAGGGGGSATKAGGGGDRATKRRTGNQCAGTMRPGPSS